METNTRILITFLMILLVILSFSLGYFVARSHAETRFFNIQSKLAKKRLDMMKGTRGFHNDIKIKKVEARELPLDFLKFIEELEKEEEEENKKNEK